MKYHEAAIEVLKAAKRPLTVQEVTDRAIERGLIAPSGKTPAATMAAVLYVRLQNHPDVVQEIPEAFSFSSWWSERKRWRKLSRKTASDSHDARGL